MEEWEICIASWPPGVERYYRIFRYKSVTMVAFFCQDFLYPYRMKDSPHLLEAIAVTVEKLRKERKLTKTLLANYADLQECYIRGITKGRRNPTIVALYAICEALEVPPEEFFRMVTVERDNLSGSGTCKAPK